MDRNYRWMLLYLWKARTLSEAAKKCVQSLMNKTFVEQLVDRRIISIIRQPLFVQGGLAPVGFPQEHGFFIYINDNIRLGPPSLDDDHLFTYAHEIAHTFNYHFIEEGQYPPRTRSYEIGLRPIERFCDHFARIYLSNKSLKDSLLTFLVAHPEPDINVRALWPTPE